MNSIQLISVFVGGGLGSLCRFGISKYISSQNFFIEWPVATLLANMFSCIVMGLMVYLGLKMELSDHLKTFVLVGFCGGFSTFSTFSMETLLLMRSGGFLWATGNVLISVVACITILFLLTSGDKL